ncbi:hypothetical protein OK016_27245 [Vibrio chagasii]|nr:hypothetical protein [Vibrio chagasii]
MSIYWMSKLQRDMFTQGEIAIERLSCPGSVDTMHNFFAGQADALLDEMTRSILGRPATTQEIRNKEIVPSKWLRGNAFVLAFPGGGSKL